MAKRDIAWYLIIKYKLKQALTLCRPQVTFQAPVRGTGPSAITFSSVMTLSCILT